MRRRFSKIVLALLCFGSTGLAQNATSTALAITSGGNPVASVREQTAVTLTASVFSGNTHVTPGQIEFCDAAPPHCTDIHRLALAQLTGSGTAVLNFFPAAGAHTYYAVFLGTHISGPSSASATLTVNPYYPTETVITYADTLGLGTYSLDVSVTGSGGTSPPTGAISILDESNANYVLGTAQLVPGSVGGSGGNASGLTPSLFTTTPSVYNAGIVAADFNGDGKKDLAVGNYLGNSLTVLLGNGNGQFTLEPNLTVGTDPLALATADFNGDGKADIAAVNFGGYTVQAFPIVSPPAPPPGSVWFIDPIVGDPNPTGTVSILIGNGDGTFAAARTLPASLNPAPTFVAVGDFNGDGIPDLAVTNADDSALPAIASVNILLGKGDGTFTLSGSFPTGVHPVGVTVGDFNGDGFQDLAVVNSGDKTISILLGNGDGTFRPQTTMPSTGFSSDPTGIIAADFNGDGFLDLAVENYGSPGLGQFNLPGSIWILLGNGTGTFTPQIEIIGRNHLNSIAVGDFNADGKPDLIVSDYIGLVDLLLGKGDGSFATPLDLTTQNAVGGVTAADFNGDGVSDIAFSGLYVNPNVGTMLAQVGSQTLTATATTIVSNFFVVGAGSHNVIASYPGDNTYAPSVSATEGLTADPLPTTLSFSVTPSTTNYGQPVMLTAVVAPIAAQNHTATGTITFSNGTTIVGTSPMVGGVATFNTAMLPAGVDTLTAAYSGDANFDSSSETETETVNGSQTVTTLAVAPNPARVGQAITLTASVVGVSFAAVPTGLITFYSGATALAQVAVDATGHASYSATGLPFGSYSISAVYSGDAAFYASTSPIVTLVIGGFASTVAVTAAPNPAGVGQIVTMTAGVSGVGSTRIATGTVMFYDGVNLLGVAPLDASGHASLSTTALTLGTHSLIATYAGDGSFSASSSPAYSEVVQSPGFTISLASPSITLQTYYHTTTSVMFSSAGNFNDTLALRCTNVPAFVTCIFTPNQASLTAQGSSTVSLYIDTDSILGADARKNLGGQSRNAPAPTPGLPIHLTLLILPAGLLAAARRVKPRNSSLWLLLGLLSLPLALAVNGCGGDIITPVPSTAPGTYNIGITASGATTGVTHTAQLILTVTP